MMPESPIPPDIGWTLREAAAALFPTEWAAATLPDNAMDARYHPGIAPAGDPLVGLPIERLRRILAAGVHRDRTKPNPVQLLPDDTELLEAHHRYEEVIAARIAAARKAAEAARDALPQLLAARMQNGDLLAYGVDTRSGLNASPTLIPPHIWGVAVPHLGFDHPQVVGHGFRSHSTPTPEVGTVSGLPGGHRLLAVRIKAAPAAAMPVKLANDATEEQVAWFVSGYAVRAMEVGRLATRDEVRDAVVRENVGTARQAEKAHANLPAHLKNADRSKGSNRPK